MSQQQKQIVVVGPNCWGSGKTMASAVASAKRNCSAYYVERPMPYNGYEASDDFEVDEMGRISATSLKRIKEVRIVNGEVVVREGSDILND